MRKSFGRERWGRGKVIMVLVLAGWLFPLPVGAQGVSEDEAGGVTPTVAASVTVTPTTTRGGGLREGGEERQQLLEQRREERQQQLQERKAKIAEAVKARIQRHWGFIKKRLEAALARQEKLAGRIEARLNKLAEAGHDVSSQQAKLTSARAVWEEAKSSLGGLAEKWEGVLSAEDPKSEFASFREEVKGVAEKIREVHGLYVEIITEIRGLRVGNTGALTPRPTRVAATPTEVVE